MINGKKVIVSMTSWPKRIKFVAFTIYMMTQQTVKPDEIILNLSLEEFKNGNADLPTDLNLLAETLDTFKINWVKDNTKAFKKVIPTILAHKGEDCWILSVDDDILYDNGYIEYMITTASENPNHYLTPNISGKQPHGYAMIYNPTWFKDDLIFHITKDDMDKIIASDEWIYANLIRNKITAFKADGIKQHIKDLHRNDRLGQFYVNKSAERRKRILELTGIKLDLSYFRW